MRSKLTPDQKKQAVERLNFESKLKNLADAQKAEEDAARKAAEEAQAAKEKEKADAKAKKRR